MGRLMELTGNRTGWMYTDATAEVGCTRCGASPTEYCRTPKGRNANVPHTERTKAFVDKLKAAGEMGMYQIE